MPVLFLFEEAAWVPIRHESGGVEMQAATVQDDDIGLASPLVDSTAGPLSLPLYSFLSLLNTQPHIHNGL